MKKSLIFILILSVSLFYGCSSGDHKAESRYVYSDSGVDTEVWITIPAGEFFEGQHKHPTDVDYDYEIMATDVTNAQYARFLNKALEQGAIKVADNGVTGYYPGEKFDGFKHEFEITAGDKLLMPLGEKGLHIKFNEGRFSVDKGYENHPVTLVTWFGANAYAQFYGWRLPTEVEWEKAARGTDDRAYPWGNEISPEYANYYSSQNIFRKIFGAPVFTTPVGYYNGENHDGFQTRDGRSPYGLYDMAGNVWNWTGDDYRYTHLRYMRGGSFLNYENNLRIWARNSAGPDYYDIDVGFRCVRDL